MHGKNMLSAGVDAILSHQPQTMNKTKVRESSLQDSLASSSSPIISRALAFFGLGKIVSPHCSVDYLVLVSNLA